MAFHTDRLPYTLPPAGTAGRRAALFRETPLETLERLALGAAWALKPPRHKMLPALARLWLTDLMAPDHALPDPETDLADGLAGIVHDLSVPTLLGAYERGLYPFAHAGPLKWWSAPNRSVLFFDEFHFSKNQRRLMRQGRYTVTFDRDFETVITACAGRRSGRWHLTWITPRIMHAYAEAFDASHAHSFEVWNEKGELAGGGYGLSVGAAFFVESQFSREPNTGKIGMTVLNWHLAKWGYHFNDVKLTGPLWQSLGFREIPRAEFLARAGKAARAPGKSGRWQVEADPATVSQWQPGKH